MNSATINIKVDPQTKKQAQKIADDIGLSLSGILNAYLKEFIRTRAIKIELPKEEELTDYAKAMLAASQADLKAGRVSPAFATIEEMEHWFNDPNATYANGDKVSAVQ